MDDIRPPSSRQGRRAVVGMTSIPSRLSEIGPTLASLLEQERVPDEIFLSLPQVSSREQRGYDVPAWIDELPNVTILRPEVDYGPGTKLLGCVEQVRDDDVLILMDDDLRYAPFVVRELVDAVVPPNVAASFHVYESRGIHVGQGADGLAMPGWAARSCASMVPLIMRHRELRMMDDYWISFELRRLGVRLRDVSHVLPTYRVDRAYEHVHEISPLLTLEGDMSRMRLMRESNRILYREASPTVRMRLDRILGYGTGARRVASRRLRGG